MTYARIFQSDDSVAGSFCLRDSSGFAYSRFAPSALLVRVSSQQVRLVNIHCMGEREQSQGEKSTACL